jgi:hypothetical protein
MHAGDLQQPSDIGVVTRQRGHRIAHLSGWFAPTRTRPSGRGQSRGPRPRSDGPHTRGVRTNGDTRSRPALARHIDWKAHRFSHACARHCAPAALRTYPTRILIAPGTPFVSRSTLPHARVQRNWGRPPEYHGGIHSPIPQERLASGKGALETRSANRGPVDDHTAGRASNGTRRKLRGNSDANCLLRSGFKTLCRDEQQHKIRRFS